jgi:hypothetical protein
VERSTASRAELRKAKKRKRLFMFECRDVCHRSSTSLRRYEPNEIEFSGERSEPAGMMRG